MQRSRPTGYLLLIRALICAVALASCAPGIQPAPSGEQSGGSAPVMAVKRVKAAIMSEPTLWSGRDPGGDILPEMLNSRLAIVDDKGILRPQLAVLSPSLENGFWTLLPDGRMETTWQIRPEATWHDGAPFTSADLLFTTKARGDNDIPFTRSAAYKFIDRVEAPDARTVTVYWKQPYVDADAMFSTQDTAPLPVHLLERFYLEDKASFVDQPYWSDQFIGTGPFKLRTWVRGSHLIMEANPRYVLGRPRIDEIEVKFIPDQTALMAQILAGEVELTLGRNLSLAPAIQVRDQWRDGRMDYSFIRWVPIFPQFVNPSPVVVTNLPFRRALLHAIDRQQLVDELLFGISSVAHSYLNPGQPRYAAIEARLPRYDYDPRKATQMIADLGYTMAADGIFRDAGGQRLAVTMRTLDNLDHQPKTMFAIVDFWQRVGVETDTTIVPPQRIMDREYRQTFPGFYLLQNTHDVEGLDRLHSSNTPLPENRFAGSNHSRYRNPDFDALLDRYFVTIPADQRTELLGQISYHIADQLSMMGLYYATESMMIGNRLVNVAARQAMASSQTWNVEQWDLK